MSQPQPPTPNPAKDYRESLKVYLKYLPQLLQGEQDARVKYDPQRIEEQMHLQDLYGARQSQQQLDALQRIDPQGVAIRKQLGNAVSSDLASGYHLPEGFNTELTSQIRGAEAARGNVLGGAPIAAEDLYKGKAMIDLYQQHETNAGAFLAGATPEQQLSLVQPVTPDRTSQFVNPSAPGQMGQNNYQNMLAQWQAAGGGRNPWASSAIGGVSGGVNAGMMSGGNPYAIGAGAIVGGVAGYFSSRRLKKDIQKIGEHNGLDRIEFRYKGGHTKYRGVVAEQVQALFPDAVHCEKGFLKVDYDKLGIPFEKRCRDCGVFKTINDFQKRPNCASRDGHRNKCIECQNAYKRGYYGGKHRDKWQQYHHDYYKARKREWKDSALKRDFGLTIEDYERMAEEQGGVCAICGGPPSSRGLMVDHCHDSGAVRGLLCQLCNTGLGGFRDNPLVLTAAIEYLNPKDCPVKFSDTRLKENIVPEGFSHRGYPIYTFNYKDCPGRFRGTIAQAILPMKPSAVTMDKSGFWKVDYDQLDIKLEEIPEPAMAGV